MHGLPMTSRIRLATLADANEIARIYAPFCSETAISFEDAAPSVDEMARPVQQILQCLPWLIFEGEGAVLGYAYAGAIANARPIVGQSIRPCTLRRRRNARALAGVSILRCSKFSR